MEVRLLNADDVADLLDEASCIEAVEGAFRELGEGRAGEPVVAGLHVAGGGFHIKAGMLEAGRAYFAAKTNANFPENGRHGLPTIQGVLLLFDAERGIPLAVMDAAEVTVRRTAAATAVAARYLSRADAAVAMVWGCGVQGRAQIRALTHVLPLERVHAFDRDPSAAERFAGEMSEELGLDVRAVTDPRRHARASDVCVTCTPSRDYLLDADDVRSGVFVAGVGADSEDKRELAPGLLARGKLVVDVLEQCATIGDLHHALEAGVLTRDSVHASLGEVVAGRRAGRTQADEITIFDSTGMALQDVAAAALIYERAEASGRGFEYPLSGNPDRQ